VEPCRKRVRHFHEPGHLHEFTFSCCHRWPLLTNNDWRRRLSRAIDGANSIWRWELVAFVFMPEHIHLLANPLEPDPDIGGY
jgi:putative transposase